MPRDVDKSPNLFSNKVNFYLHVSFTGALRGAICLCLEHPLESIKTQWQDKLKFKSSKEIVNHIYAHKGVAGFYRGFIPNLIRATSKHLYRWPLMIFFPRFFDAHLPPKLKARTPGLIKILTGLTIANLEIFIMCPLDRLKIFFMTSKFDCVTNSKFVFFYSEHRHNFMRELFRGLEPTFWRSNVSWVSFLYLDFKIKKLFRNFKQTEILSFFDLFLVSIFVGGANILAVMPFDFAKTQMQKEGNIIHSHTLKIIRNFYMEQGIKVLYTGWQFKTLQYLLQSFFTVYTLDRLEIQSQSL